MVLRQPGARRLRDGKDLMTKEPDHSEDDPKPDGAITYCGVCSTEAGPFDRQEVAQHMRDVHPDLSVNGAGPPWNNGRNLEGQAS